MSITLNPDALRPGRVVGWVQHGGPSWGEIKKSTEKHVVVATSGGDKKIKIPALTIATDGPVEDVVADAQLQLKALDAKAAWEGLTAGFGQDRFSVDEAAGFLAKSDQTPAVWLLLWSNPDFFARAGRTEFRVRRLEEVLAERERIEQRREEERLLNQLAILAEQYKQGALSFVDLVAQEPVIQQVARHLAYGDDVDMLSERGRHAIENVLAELHQESNPAWPLSWFIGQQLGDPDPWQHASPTLARHRKWLQTLDVEPESLLEAELLEPRTQLWAIDDPGTTDRDDAIGVALDGEQVIVEIAVADVARTIAAEPSILEQAVILATSIYLPTATIPMLPDAYGAARHSLGGEQAKPVFLLRVVLDRQTGKLLEDPELARGSIQLTGVTSYDAVDSPQNPITDWAIATEMTERLHEQRFAGGASDVRLPDVAIEIRDGHPLALREMKPWLGARSVVRELMILANATFARILKEHKLPAPFRGMRKKRHNIVARVEIQPSAHVGLGVEQYLYATSPIRRCSDILAQLQLASLFGEPPFTDKEMHTWLRKSEANFQESKRWMESAVRYWKLRYLEANSDIELHALAEPRNTDQTGTTRVRISPLNLVTYIRSELADDDKLVPLTLKHVDAERNEVTFELA